MARYRLIHQVVGLTVFVCIVESGIASAESGRTAYLDYDLVGDTIPLPLTQRAGNAVNGRVVFLDRERGHCLLCHQVTSLDAPYQGTIGPALTDVGERLSAAQLRLRLVDATRVNPDAAMPAYYRVRGLRQVGEDYDGKPVLTAQEIEDLIAFLRTLSAEKPDELRR